MNATQEFVNFVIRKLTYEGNIEALPNLPDQKTLANGLAIVFLLRNLNFHVKLNQLVLLYMYGVLYIV